MATSILQLGEVSLVWWPPITRQPFCYSRPATARQPRARPPVMPEGGVVALQWEGCGRRGGGELAGLRARARVFLLERERAAFGHLPAHPRCASL